jgi:hypothetical protein
MAFMLPAILFSCTDNEYEQEKEQNGKKSISISGEIDQVMVTRVSDDGFADGDVIGAYIVDYVGDNAGALLSEGNRANNLKHTYDEGNYKWNAAYDVYWKDNKTPIDVYTYYPYTEISDVNCFSFEVKKDQSKATESGQIGNYEASDFLWGKSENVAPTAQRINVPMKHRMANIRVNLTKGDGFTTEEWNGFDKNLLVTGTMRKSTIDLSTGSVEAVGSVSEGGIVAMGINDEFRAIIVPQVMAAGTQLFVITVNGISYSFKRDEETVYTQGKMHNFDINVSKKESTGDYEFKIESESITAWENDRYSHDALAREYIVVKSEAGKLKEAIVATGKDYTKIKNLKVTGEIYHSDFYFMNYDMSSLQSLNLKDVKIKGTEYTDWDGSSNTYGEDEIPSSAFSNKTSLIRIILPDQLKSISYGVFEGCRNLTGNMIIPEGVTRIESNAFHNCNKLKGNLYLPSTLTHIGSWAFYNCGFNCELNLPANLEIIESYAFYYCTSLYGSINLPEKLKKLGDWSFGYCQNLTGSIEIPYSITSIENGVFCGSGFNGTLKLHDGITDIGEYAFSDCKFKGELILPKNLTSISNSAFRYNNFSGELTLHSGLVTIGEFAFGYNSKLSGILKIPEVSVIGRYAFEGCSSIQGLVFLYEVNDIEDDAFSGCYGITSIECKNPNPSNLSNNVFSGVPKESFPLIVPESAIQRYKQAYGWNEFKQISAYKELKCEPSSACALNAEKEIQLNISAEGEWEVESCPDWCTLSVTSGNKNTPITLTISEYTQDPYDYSSNKYRTDKIVFKLKDTDFITSCNISQYNCFNYKENDVFILQTATKGNGVNIVIIGEGFDASSHHQMYPSYNPNENKTSYRYQIDYSYDAIFRSEPFKAYKEYFNVYAIATLSQETGIGSSTLSKNNLFGTTYSIKGGISADYDKIFKYACMAPTVNKDNLNQTLVIVSTNSSELSGGTIMWKDGCAISFCSTYYALLHEAVGHGFGKLADEHVMYSKTIDEDSKQTISDLKNIGWFENLSMTGKIKDTPWYHLTQNSKYADYTDVYEGGYFYRRGIYRSENKSVMSSNAPYFNTASRESIVKRIMEYAGEEYSYEEFLKKDNMDEYSQNLSTFTHEQVPVIYNNKPSYLTK